MEFWLYYIFWKLTFYLQCSWYKSFSILWSVILYEWWCPFPYQSFSSFTKPHLFIVDFSAHIDGVLYRKSVPVPMSSRLFLTFFFCQIQCTLFLCQSLCFIWNWILCSVISMDSFGLLYVQSLVWTEQFFWRCCPFPACISGFFIENRVTKSVWTYFWVFNLILLILMFLCQYHAVFIFVAL